MNGKRERERENGDVQGVKCAMEVLQAISEHCLENFMAYLMH